MRDDLYADLKTKNGAIIGMYTRKLSKNKAYIIPDGEGKYLQLSPETLFLTINNPELYEEHFLVHLGLSTERGYSIHCEGDIKEKKLEAD